MIDVGKRNGFVIVIKESDSSFALRKPSLTLACKWSGQYREDTRSRNVSRVFRIKGTSTKKCKSPFQLKGKKLTADDDWLLLVICGVHNHPIIVHLKCHSYVGRFFDEESSLLKDISKSNVWPKDILTTMKQRDALNTTIITMCDINKRRVIDLICNNCLDS